MPGMQMDSYINFIPLSLQVKFQSFRGHPLYHEEFRESKAIVTFCLIIFALS